MSPLNSISAGENHTCASFSGLAFGSVYCWGANGSGQIGLPAASPNSANLPQQVGGFGAPLSTQAVAVSAGGDHSCALDSNKKVWCWGSDSHGQLGRGGSAVPDHTPVAVSGITSAIAIGSGDLHSCALLENSEVWCWGSNQFKQLGVASPASTSIPVRVIGLRTSNGP